MDHLGRLQTELVQRFRWPPRVLTLLVLRTRGLRHQQPAAHLEERSGALGQNRRPAERAGQDPVETRPRAPLSSAHLGSLLQDRDAGLEAESLYSTAEEGSPAAVGLQQRHRDLRPVRRHDQAGQAAPRTKINEASRTMPTQAAGDGGKALGVADLRIQGTGSQEAQGASFLQELLYGGGGGTPCVGAGHRRRVSPRSR
jgi:hypothetical protein